MKKTNIIIITIFISIIIIIGCVVGIKNTKGTTIPDKIVITQYEPGTNTQIKKINITSKDEIKKVNKYIKNIKPLSDSEMVNLALLQEVVIEYGDSIRIGIQLEEKYYCHYNDKEQNISSLSKCSNDLYEWVNEKLNK